MQTWFALTNRVFLPTHLLVVSRRMWLGGTDNEETPDSKWPSWNKWFIKIWERFCPIRNLFSCCSHPLRQQHQAPHIALSSQLSYGTAGEIHSTLAHKHKSDFWSLVNISIYCNWMCLISPCSQYNNIPILVSNLGNLEQQDYWRVSGTCPSLGQSQAVNQHRYIQKLSLKFKTF